MSGLEGKETRLEMSIDSETFGSLRDWFPVRSMSMGFRGINGVGS